MNRRSSKFLRGPPKKFSTNHSSSSRIKKVVGFNQIHPQSGRLKNSSRNLIAKPNAASNSSRPSKEETKETKLQTNHMRSSSNNIALTEKIQTISLVEDPLQKAPDVSSDREENSDAHRQMEPTAFPSSPDNDTRTKERQIFKRRMNRIATKQVLVNYFVDDAVDKELLSKIEDKYFYHPYKVNFSAAQYIEQLALHFSSFFLLGPFINIYSLFFCKHKYYMSNTYFSRLGPAFFVQLIQWVSNIWMYIIVFVIGSEVGDFNSIFVIFFAVLTRVSTIAAKYATYPKNQMRKVREVFLTDEEIAFELMGTSWLTMKMDIIQAEIDNAIKRKEVDPSMFEMTFMTDLCPDMKKRLREIEKERLKKEEDLEKEKENENGKEVNGIRKPFRGEKSESSLSQNHPLRQSKRYKREYFNGRDLMQLFNEEFRERNKNFQRNSMPFCLFVGLSYGFGPGIVRLFFGQSFHGKGFLVIFGFYYNSLATTLMILFVMIFFTVYRFDAKRRLYLLRNVEFLINYKKEIGDSEPKILPTMNLVDKLTLNSWMELRKIVMDFGRKFYYRHQIFLPAIILSGLVSALTILGIVFFKVEDRVGEDKKTNLRKLIAFLVYNFGVMFLLGLYMIYQASQINKEFNDHLKILQSNKQFYKDLKFFKDFYFNYKDDSTDRSQYSAKNKTIYTYNERVFRGKKSMSIVHRILAKEIQDNLDVLNDETVDAYMEDILEINESLIEELGNEKEYGSMEILGFPITEEVVLNFVVGCLSLALGIYEFVFNNNS